MESRRRHAGAARVGGVEREEEVEAPAGVRGEKNGRWRVVRSGSFGRARSIHQYMSMFGPDD